jgi:hypothetical protein
MTAKRVGTYINNTAGFFPDAREKNEPKDPMPKLANC